MVLWKTTLLDFLQQIKDNYQTNTELKTNGPINMTIKKLSIDKHQNVRYFFSARFPNSPLIYSVIEGTIPGQIWVDDEDCPTVCLVITGAPYCFVAGKIDERIFQEFLPLLKEKERVSLAFDPTISVEHLHLPKLGFTPVARRQYQYKEIDLNKIPEYKNENGLTLKKIADESTFDLCLWKSLITSFFGNTDHYLKHGIGFVLLDTINQRIASEAHGIASKELIEVGTITDETYRGKGLSTIVCSHLIRTAIKKGLHPVWTCDDANVASWKVAEKQGMDDMTKYTFHILKVK
jgi:hypothetical protein